MVKSNRKTYLYIIIGMLVVSLLYVGSALFKDGPSTNKRPQSQDVKPDVIKERRIPESITKIASPPKEALDKKEITYPNLRLEGTIMSIIPSAYIRDLDTNQASFYNRGDNILSATLIEIKRGEVTLDVEGNIYSLYLESQQKDSPITEASPGLRIVNFDRLIEAVKNDAQGLKDLAGISPHKDTDGNFAGYKIDGIKWGSLPYLAGFRNGDIVNNINGQNLSTQQKAIQTFKKVRRLKDINLVLLRDKKEVNLKYKVRE